MDKNVLHVHSCLYEKRPIMGLVNYALRSSNLFTHWMFYEDFPFAYFLKDISDDKTCFKIMKTI